MTLDTFLCGTIIALMIFAALIVVLKVFFPLVETDDSDVDMEH